ncbi:Oxygen-evolving enhancer protein 3, chloroplastic [Dendrobium catenatum]|uniref:Oxygen-evolving enhancer protein 3, chloroplastic n=1 Tax=Dendrobium catenatum TaxID=906689 RepID=A0A2I0X0M8_9ASPA|nr:Oxygen-evolving enhancer protein 3, chloroplastic [Dendrobium catenatum]
MRGLRKLDLSWLINLSNSSVIAIAQNCQNLLEIRLIGCEQITVLYISSRTIEDRPGTISCNFVPDYVQKLQEKFPVWIIQSDLGSSQDDQSMAQLRRENVERNFGKVDFRATPGRFRPTRQFRKVVYARFWEREGSPGIKVQSLIRYSSSVCVCFCLYVWKKVLKQIPKPDPGISSVSFESGLMNRCERDPSRLRVRQVYGSPVVAEGEPQSGHRAMLGLFTTEVADITFINNMLAEAKPIKIGPLPTPSGDIRRLLCFHYTSRFLSPI